MFLPKKICCFVFFKYKEIASLRECIFVVNSVFHRGNVIKKVLSKVESSEKDKRGAGIELSDSESQITNHF